MRVYYVNVRNYSKLDFLTRVGRNYSKLDLFYVQSHLSF